MLCFYRTLAVANTRNIQVWMKWSTKIYLSLFISESIYVNLSKWRRNTEHFFKIKCNKRKLSQLLYFIHYCSMAWNIWFQTNIFLEFIIKMRWKFSAIEDILDTITYGIHRTWKLPYLISTSVIDCLIYWYFMVTEYVINLVWCYYSDSITY